jgi:hypothetical protein
MVDFHRDNQDTYCNSQPAGSATVRELGERIERYFHLHPDVSRAEFIFEAVRHELSLREQRKYAAQDAVHAEFHADSDNLDEQCAAVAVRLTDLQYQRHGIWPRMKRFFLHQQAEE